MHMLAYTLICRHIQIYTRTRMQPYARGSHGHTPTHLSTHMHIQMCSSPSIDRSIPAACISTEVHGACGGTCTLIRMHTYRMHTINKHAHTYLLKNGRMIDQGS